MSEIRKKDADSRSARPTIFDTWNQSEGKQLASMAGHRERETHGFRVYGMEGEVSRRHELVPETKVTLLSHEQENQLHDESVEENIHEVKSSRRDFATLGLLRLLLPVIHLS